MHRCLGRKKGLTSESSVELNCAPFILKSAVFFGCRRAEAHRAERYSPTTSVLSREVEQPLAEQSVVLFQVLDQVGLLLHHLLQVGTLSGRKKSTFRALQGCWIHFK